MAAPSSKIVFAVLNLSWTCIKKDLKTHFSKYGRVVSVSIPIDLKTGFNKRVGFVEVRGPEGFEEKVIQDFHTIDHQEVTVRARERSGQTEPKTPPPETSV